MKNEGEAEVLAKRPCWFNFRNEASSFVVMNRVEIQQVGWTGGGSRAVCYIFVFISARERCWEKLLFSIVLPFILGFGGNKLGKIAGRSTNTVPSSINTVFVIVTHWIIIWFWLHCVIHPTRCVNWRFELTLSIVKTLVSLLPSFQDQTLFDLCLKNLLLRRAMIKESWN